MKIPIRNIYYLLLYAWDCLDESSDILVAGAKGETWVDLAARIMLAWIEKQQRRGLDRGYLDVVETTGTIRGKILATPTLRYRELQRGRAVCWIDELNVDTPLNRTVKAAITTLLSSNELDARLSGRLHSARASLSAVTDCRLTEHLCHYAQTSSNNRTYQLPVSIARLLAMQLMASEGVGQFRFADFDRDDGPLAELFESFVRNFLRREQSVFLVKRRVMDWVVTNIDAAGRALLPQMRTDVTLESQLAHVIIETKYYGKPLVSYLGSEKFRAYHLYQLSAYLQAHQFANPAVLSTAGVLLYAQPRSAAFDARFSLNGQAVRILTVDLTDEWTTIKSDLLEVVDWARSSTLDQVVGRAASLP